MLDIQFIRDNRELVQQAAKNKNSAVNIDALLRVDDEIKALMPEVEQLRHQRRQLAESTKGTKPNDEQIQQGQELKDQLGPKTEKLDSLLVNREQLLRQVPNLPLDDVPLGTSEADNQVSKVVGEPPKFDFSPKTHWQIGEAKDWIDKERAAKVTGSRFAYIKGDLVKLQIALIEFVIDKLTNPEVLKKIADDNNLSVSDKPFVPVLPPLMIRTQIYDDMDRLEPRDDRYKIEGEDLWLQGSAEHVLGSMHADEIIPEAELPIRYLGYATSFRKEAGSYGKDMEGLFRLHQFDKLEMESLTAAEQGLSEHLFLIAIQEYLMQQLEIPYHVLMKCTADIGKPNARGVDLEAWLPGQNKYRETHTADYMTDYQARRLRTRVRRQNGEVQLVHTNDATALALSRTPIAIIENFQQPDGTVKIPQALQSYLAKENI